MEEGRYYYSKTGSDVNGPVTKHALHQLLKTRRITFDGFFCCEEGTEWKPLNSQLFPVPQPILATPTATKGSKVRRRRIPWYTNERLVDPYFQKKLSLCCWIGTFAGAAFAVHLRYVAFSTIQTSAESVLEVVGYFLGVATILALIPSLLSLAFPYPRTRLVRAIAIPCFALLFLLVRYNMLTHDAAAVAHKAESPLIEASR